MSWAATAVKNFRLHFRLIASWSIGILASYCLGESTNTDYTYGSWFTFSKWFSAHFSNSILLNQLISLKDEYILCSGRWLIFLSYNFSLFWSGNLPKLNTAANFISIFTGLSPYKEFQTEVNCIKKGVDLLLNRRIINLYSNN